VSFHLPLHRYLSVFLCQAVAKQGITLDEILPMDEDFQVMILHPLRVQVAFYEILNELWVRNGLQIKGQAMTYIQCNFCNSMVDADLYLLQIACSRTCPNEFVTLIINSYVFLLSI
jgi:E3 ubiquitin-protein ligase UBR3